MNRWIFVQWLCSSKYMYFNCMNAIKTNTKYLYCFKSLFSFPFEKKRILSLHFTYFDRTKMERKNKWNQCIALVLLLLDFYYMYIRFFSKFSLYSPFYYYYVFFCIVKYLFSLFVCLFNMGLHVEKRLNSCV